MPVGTMSYPLVSSPSIDLGTALLQAAQARHARANAKETEAKIPYAGMTALADAASKLAYSDLMGPQFMAKLMGNENLLANMTEPQRKTALGQIYSKGSGQSGLRELILNSLAKGQPQSENAGSLKDKILSYFSQQQPQQQNAPMVPAQQPQIAQPEAAPEQQMNASPIAQQPEKTFPENTAEYKEIVKKGESYGSEIGKKNADKVDELQNTVFNNTTKQETLDELSDLVVSPEFRELRQLPILGKHELSYYDKYGTKQQKDAVGKYYTLTGTLVKDSARDFAGQFRTGEQALLENMKPSKNDMVDTAVGKIETLSNLNKLLTQRASLTADLMEKKKLSFLDAQKQADKALDGDAIRKSIHERLHPEENKSANKIGNIEVPKEYTIKMKSPDGRIAMVHGEDLDQALKEGWLRG